MYESHIVFYGLSILGKGVAQARYTLLGEGGDFIWTPSALLLNI